MITRNQLSITTPNTLLLGIASNGKQTAVTGALRLRNGSMEPEVIETVGGDIWQATNEAFADLRIIKATHVLVLTTCDELFNFLQKPIRVEQPTTKSIRVGREVFTVKTGGNEHQWSILRHLFMYVWRCERVTTLKKAEELLNA